MPEWITENLIALAALGLSIITLVVQAVAFFFSRPRAHWVLERLEVYVPNLSEIRGPITGPRSAQFTFRNAGTATAHLTTFRKSIRAEGFPPWLLVGNERDMTMPPGAKFIVEVHGELTQRTDLKKQWSSGDGFWFKTDDVVRITWTHRPTRIPLTYRRSLRLERIQLAARIQPVGSFQQVRSGLVAEGS